MKSYVISREGLDFVALSFRDSNRYVTEQVEVAKWFDTYEDALNFLNEDCWQFLGRYFVYEVECSVKKAEK